MFSVHLNPRGIVIIYFHRGDAHALMSEVGQQLEFTECDQPTSNPISLKHAYVLEAEYVKLLWSTYVCL